jgi:hypothetical protein
MLDGNALLTLCIDWSSRVHDVVYSIAGNQGKGGIPIPTDNFNAINVAFSSEREGIFNKVHVSNLASINQGIENRLAGKAERFINKKTYRNSLLSCSIALRKRRKIPQMD